VTEYCVNKHESYLGAHNGAANPAIPAACAAFIVFIMAGHSAS